MFGPNHVIQQYDDSFLWDRFRAGQLPAFTELYNTYVQTLYNYGKRFTTDSDLIEDCIQDLFVELWHKKETLGDTDSPKYYLLKSLRNRLFRRFSQYQKFTSDGLEEYDFEVELSYELSLIDEQAAVQQRDQLQQALRQLTKRQREIIFLKFYENLSYEEIATVMSLEVKSAYNLVSKAVEAIKRYLLRSFLLFFFSLGLID
jgi:RNA polymerase sigma factor (sigma-70 family)